MSTIALLGYMLLDRMGLVKHDDPPKKCPICGRPETECDCATEDDDEPAQTCRTCGLPYSQCCCGTRKVHDEEAMTENTLVLPPQWAREAVERNRSQL